MKTIEEIAFGRYLSDQSLPKHKRMDASNYIDWAQLGATEVQRWIPVTEELPIVTEFGNWDGHRSEFVIAKNKYGAWYKARIYSGIMDGSKFCNWCDETDSELTNIVSWRPIERL
jgi:hypothetical protein